MRRALFGALFICAFAAARATSDAFTPTGVYFPAAGNATPAPTASASPTPTPTLPPQIIGSGALINPGNGFTVDPGPTPDAYLFSALEVAQESLPATTCGQAFAPNCTPYAYKNWATNTCVTTEQQNTLTWAVANDENAFTHQYGGTISSGNRLVNPNGTPSPCSPIGGSTNPLIMNLDDPAFLSYLQTNFFFNTTYVPSGYGFFEDTPYPTGEYIDGETSSLNSAGYAPSLEYSNGWNAGNTTFVDTAGNSIHAQGVDWQTAMAAFSNAAYPLSMFFNGGAPTGPDATQACNIISGGRCHDVFYSGYINDQYPYNKLCDGTVTKGNFRGMLWENAIEHKLNGGTYPTASTLQLIALINTVATFVNYSNCNNAVIYDYEYPFGPSGPATTPQTDSVPNIMLITALHWMVPDPANGLIDRLRYTMGTLGGVLGSPTEMPYFFPQTLVPTQPLKSVGKFVWNGNTQTVGGGCPANGDQGGSLTLLVLCPDSSGGGIYVQQYQHVYIANVDYGPGAAILNLSATTETLSSSWFLPQAPMSTYNYYLTPVPGALTSVAYQGITGNAVSLSALCTDSNCVGSDVPSANMTVLNQSSPPSICGRCGMIVLANN